MYCLLVPAFSTSTHNTVRHFSAQTMPTYLQMRKKWLRAYACLSRMLEDKEIFTHYIGIQFRISAFFEGIL